MSKPQRITINISVVKVGNSALAATEIGGIHVKGSMADDARYAVQSLLAELAKTNGDAAIGIELALAGTSLGELTGGE